MPFLELNNLYEELDPNRIPLKEAFHSGFTADDQRLLQTRIEAYRCPSDVAPDTHDFTFGANDFFSPGTSNYVAYGGAGTTAVTLRNNNDAHGTFFGASYLKFVILPTGPRTPSLSASAMQAESDRPAAATKPTSEPPCGQASRAATTRVVLTAP